MAQEALLAASRAKAEEEAAQKAQQELAKEAAANAELAKRRQAEQEIAAARDAENAAREAANRATFELMAVQKAAQPPDEMETQIEDPEMEELRKLEEQNALLEAEVTARRVLAERQEKERRESEKQRRRLEVQRRLEEAKARTAELKRQLSGEDNLELEATPLLKRSRHLQHDTPSPTASTPTTPGTEAAAATAAQGGATPGASTLGGTPGATSLGGQPGAATLGGTAGAATLGGTPGAATLGATPGATALGGQPGAATLGGTAATLGATPGAATLGVKPGAALSAALEKSKSFLNRAPSMCTEAPSSAATEDLDGEPLDEEANKQVARLHTSFVRVCSSACHYCLELRV